MKDHHRRSLSWLPFTVSFLAPFATGCTVATLPSERAQGPEEAQVLQHEGPLNRHVEMDSNEISQSIGHAGGFVVLWPRIPKTGDPKAHAFAERVQHRLQSIAAATDAGASIDTRPEPERVCPKTGCAGVTVSAVVAVKGEACAAAALVARPGQSPTRIIQWIGKIELKRPETPFRDPPESGIRISDFANCKTVFEAMDQNAPPADEAALKAAIQAAHAP